MGTTEDMALILKRFGDEQSTLFDRYERLSFEVQLNQAILGRSMSEPSVHRRKPAPPEKPVQQWRRQGTGFQKMVKKLLKPILGKNRSKNEEKSKVWKTLSRSLSTTPARNW